MVGVGVANFKRLREQFDDDKALELCGIKDVNPTDHYGKEYTDALVASNNKEIKAVARQLLKERRKR